MGATVIVTGPLLTGIQAMDSDIHQVLTDATGRFAIERLLPGWYSLRVTSATRLPALRARVRVDVGQTALENFVLSDLLATMRLEVPTGKVSSWGEDWMWVLRTSATTRPVLRYQDAKSKSASENSKASLLEGQKLIAMIPGASRREALADDPGMGSILAYVRPLSDDADLLVAGSMGTNGLLASSLATAFRKDVLKGDPQEIALVVHQLSFADGLPLPSGEVRESLSRAQAVTLSYAHTKRITNSLSVTGGLQVDYLNAAQGVMSARPRVRLDYRLSGSSAFVVYHGAVQADGDGSLLERVGVLNAFPRVTMQASRPRLERLKHSEVSFVRKLGRTSRFEIAAYRDRFENTAVWGLGRMETLRGLEGDFLPNRAVDGVTLNAGDYSSSGLRAVYARKLGSHVKAAFVYGLGNALVVDASALGGEISGSHLRAALRPRRTQTLAGKLSARIPACKTEIITSYEWLPDDLVTWVDPYVHSYLQLQPYLGIMIRQPLPPLRFIPAQIEALADFRNLLAQGYVPLAGSGEEGLVLTPVYRSFRGGFAVQF